MRQEDGSISRRRAQQRGLAGGIPLVALALMVAAAMLLPGIAQDPGYHQFADQRPWFDVPRAADVLSNLGFALVGVIGSVRLASRSRVHFAPATEAGMWCIALALIAVAFGSAWYHLEPNDATLFWDRLPITLVIAGVLGAAIAQRVGNNAGRAGLALLIPLGIASVVYWRMTGDLSLYALVQLGGIGTLLLLVLLTRRGEDPIPWGWVIAWYVFAKVAELADREVWELTGGVIAGHALKHLLAAAAGAAALWPLRPLRTRP